MIFVTVGSQMPFDRLIQAVDQWAGRTKVDIFGQVADAQYIPKHFQFVASMAPSQYSDVVRKADLIVAHAGMGSIITALEYGKPILIMPRRGALAETRNDHQVATARQFSGKNGIAVAMDESELIQKLESWSHGDAAAPIKSAASDELLQGIRRFLIGAQTE